MKIVLIVMLGLFGVGGLLYGAYALEESSKGVKTLVVESPDGGIFTVELAEEKGEDVIVQCSEEKFKDAFRHFAKFLGVESPPVTLAAGPLALALPPSEVPENLAPAKRAAVEILKRHSPTRIILVAHSDCLLYDVVAAWQDRLGEVEARQMDDLRKAHAFLAGWFPQAEILVFYAKKDGSRLRFNPLAL